MYTVCAGFEASEASVSISTPTCKDVCACVYVDGSVCKGLCMRGWMDLCVTVCVLMDVCVCVCVSVCVDERVCAGVEGVKASVS